MLLLFLSAFIMEDSIVPSTRISALGSDFALLVEDPLTDIQFNPARLGNMYGLSIYCKPQLDANAVTSAILIPQISRNVGIGLWGSYEYYNYEQALTTDTYFPVGNTTNYLSDPTAYFFLVFPFLKDGSFFGLKFTIKQPQTKYSYEYEYVYADTNYYDSDTSMYHNTDINSFGDSDRATMWSIKGGQYLNFDQSVLEITLSLTHTNPEVSNYDSTFHEHLNTSVDNYDSTRTLNSSQDLSEDYLLNIENYDIWSYGLGASWLRELPVGRLRLFLNAGLSKGDITGQEFTTYRAYLEHRYEYTDPDTSFSYVDTIINEETSEESSISGTINRDIEEMGIGFEVPIEENMNFLVGLRLHRDHNEIEKTTSDTVKTTSTNYNTSFPVGAEFYVTRAICLRAGITPYFTVDDYEEDNADKIASKNRSLNVPNSFGVGIKPISRLDINLYASGSNLAIIDNWELGVVYNF